MCDLRVWQAAKTQCDRVGELRTRPRVASDSALSEQMNAAGLSVMYWPELQAMHIGGASARTVAQERVSRAGSQLEAWRMRSALLYYRKHHGVFGALGWQAIEGGWNRLRQWRSALAGRREKAADLARHVSQLRQAWRDTRAGAVSPARPW